MKSAQGLLILMVVLSSCLASKSQPRKQRNTSEGNILVVTCSRGCYQFIVQPTGNDSTQQFYVTNFPDSLKTFALNAHNEQKKLFVFFSGKLTGDKQTIQEAGPDDRLIPRYQLPVFRVTRISRFRY